VLAKRVDMAGAKLFFMGENALRRMAGLRMEARSACWIPLSETASVHLNSSSIELIGRLAYLFSIVRYVVDGLVSGERVG